MFRLNRAKPITFKMPVLQAPESFKGGSFKGGFFGSYAPFIIASILTILVTSFDLVTDWFAYTSIKHLDLEERFSGRHDMHLQNFYIALPKVFFAFCVIASIIYAIDVIHFLYKLIIFRKRFFDARDGVNNKDLLVEKFGGEWCVFLLVIFQDLPISLLLLALQIVVSCQCLLLINDIVFYMCVVSTCISIVWKVCQVIWSSGCCGKRTEYESGRVLTLFRITSLIFILCALAVTILNCILLKPDTFIHMIHRTDASKSSLLDKIYIEKWLEKENVVFMEEMKPTGSSHEMKSAEDLYESQYFNILLLQKVISGYNKTLIIEKDCTDLTVNLSSFIKDVDKKIMRQGAKCDVVFKFFYNFHLKTLYYNYGYRLTGRALGNQTHCKSGIFMANYSMPMPITGETPVTQEGSSSAEIISQNPKPKQLLMEVSHSIMLMSGMTDDNSKPMMYKACSDVKVVKFQRSFDPCRLIPAEQ